MEERISRRDLSLREKVFKIPEYPIVPKKSALCIIDMQYYDTHPDYGLGKKAKELGVALARRFYYEEVKRIIPKIVSLLRACRKKNIQVIHIRMASRTSDWREATSIMRERYKNMGLVEGSREADVIDELKPAKNEIALLKTSFSAFNSTNIDLILRNLGIDTLIIVGLTTNACVELTVMDAADRGYKVILVKDACSAITKEVQESSLEYLGSLFCNLKTTETILKLLNHKRLFPES